MTDVRGIPKAELHCHLGGTISPVLARRLAERNGTALPAGLFRDDDTYEWSDFAGFMKAFDGVGACLQTPDDLRDATYEYLTSRARSGTLYVELFTSPDQAARVGMSYTAHIDGIAAGIWDAERDSGIVGRIIVNCLRNLGPGRAVEVAETMVAEPHPYVVGIGMAGDETQFAAADFRPAYEIAAAAGYGCTVHAGEVCGADSVRAAIDALPVSRIGHGVRAIEDGGLVEELRRREITLEVCPGSNVALGVFPDMESHPFRRLWDAGVRVSLNSDDPPFFGTSLEGEYENAAGRFGLDRADLRRVTRTAIEAAFVDAHTKAGLFRKLEAQGQ